MILYYMDCINMTLVKRVRKPKTRIGRGEKK